MVNAQVTSAVVALVAFRVVVFARIMDNLNNASTPTSADACMSIVHSLMCHRQGGESEQFSKRAIESLVKKLKEKRDELDSLITAITTNGAHSTKCVTIPRTLDGRLQIAGRKCFPHVIYAKIWRWPDLHKNELRRSEECIFAFDLKVDSVCVNPYHYVRDVSLGVDLAALTLHQHHQQALYPKNPELPTTEWNAHNPDYWNNYNNYTTAPSNNGNYPHEINYLHMPSSWHNHQQARKSSTLDYKETNAITVDEATNNKDNSNSTWTPEVPINKPKSPVLSNFSTNLPINGNVSKEASEPTSKSPPPDHWCSITYYELDNPVGETFKAPSKGCPLVQIDGYVDQSDQSRFCLGALSNVQRKEVSEETRLHIGKGVLLELEGEGDIWLTCQSRYAVFVQSHYLDWKAGRQPGEVVHKIAPNVRLKVFDLRQCYMQMKDQVTQGSECGSTTIGGHLAPALSHANAASGVGIDDLRKLCTFRLSFVKGYGPDYPRRKSIMDTPCWIQIQLHRGLQVLDELLQSKCMQEQNIKDHQREAAANANPPIGLLTTL